MLVMSVNMALMCVPRWLLMFVILVNMVLLLVMTVCMVLMPTMTLNVFFVLMQTLNVILFCCLLFLLLGSDAYYGC